MNPGVWTLIAFAMMFGVPLLFTHVLDPLAGLIFRMRWEWAKWRHKREIRNAVTNWINEQERALLYGDGTAKPVGLLHFDDKEGA
jgi:hypothetical protein